MDGWREVAIKSGFLQAFVQRNVRDLLHQHRLSIFSRYIKLFSTGTLTDQGQNWILRPQPLLNTNKNECQ